MSLRLQKITESKCRHPVKTKHIQFEYVQNIQFEYIEIDQHLSPENI